MYVLDRYTEPMVVSRSRFVVLALTTGIREIFLHFLAN